MMFLGFDLWAALWWGMLTLMSVWVMRMLWAVDPQGWMFLVILSGLNLILAVLSAITVTGVILIYCLTPGIKQASGEPAMRAA